MPINIAFSTLVATWADRRSGVLEVYAQPEGLPLLVPWCCGAVLTPALLDAPTLLSPSCVLRFEEIPVQGTADWVGTGALLLDIGRAMARAQASRPESPLQEVLRDLEGLLKRARPRSGAELPSAGVLPQDGPSLMQQAEALMRALAWEDADALLTRAADQRMDQPEVLAALAFTRLHNRRQPWRDRLADSRRLIQLAHQLAPELTLYQAQRAADLIGEACDAQGDASS